MRQMRITATLLLTIFCRMDVAQRANAHTNDWQVAVSPPVVEPKDTKSQQNLIKRGELFDKFAPIRSATAASEPGLVIYSPGSIGPRPELPVGESDAIVVGKPSRHLAHLSPSGNSVYTEIVLTPTDVIKSGPGSVKIGKPLSILESGGAIRTADGKVLRSPVTPREFALTPKHSYLAFLRFNPAGEFYELIKSWDVTTGIAVPNSAEDVQLAKENRSKYAGLPERALVDQVESTLKRAGEQK